MQPIQDKELDQLFKNTFAEAEMLPSKELWSSKLVEMPKAKKKKPFSFVWMAAASLAVVFTFSLFNKQEKLKLFNPNVEIAEEFESVEVAEVPPHVDTQENFVHVAQPVQEGAIVQHKEQSKPIDEVPASGEVKSIVETLVDPVLKEAVSLKPTIYAAVEQPETNTSSLSADDAVAEVAPVKPERIRNVGELVNFVVDKLDKRDKKAIQFKTEDDESSIIGINIGLFKFNAKRK